MSKPLPRRKISHASVDGISTGVHACLNQPEASFVPNEDGRSNRAKKGVLIWGGCLGNAAPSKDNYHAEGRRGGLNPQSSEPQSDALTN